MARALLCVLIALCLIMVGRITAQTPVSAASRQYATFQKTVYVGENSACNTEGGCVLDKVRMAQPAFADFAIGNTFETPDKNGHPSGKFAIDSWWYSSSGARQDFNLKLDVQWSNGWLYLYRSPGGKTGGPTYVQYSAIYPVH